ncbi:Piso0_003124 [Millerozyma farinosa CBS 7064]|uniref:Piso0_003124 protein n=1 Tax=Pichia sorbitophila (strain ATCC MYA-4447 / BCRC 22081 / CBS 7064 / NBRC 10061 / NRRL Y-12695) TaxID=559304 RepID=G8YKE7_PICSO|nr:Piso0_003124 [Millerozyma farinosa CBS 7064]CCE80792.1 Piso0_003124 [Millerozyma farinosa CBS 7064]
MLAPHAPQKSRGTQHVHNTIHVKCISRAPATITCAHVAGGRSPQSCPAEVRRGFCGDGASTVASSDMLRLVRWTRQEPRRRRRWRAGAGQRCSEEGCSYIVRCSGTGHKY